MENKEHLFYLEQLSALQMDSINGFEQLREKIEEPGLKRFFSQCELQSRSLWEELNKEIVRLHGDIKTKGTVKGAINHLWMKLRTDLLKSDLPTVLNNILACEEFNIGTYQSVVKMKFPENLKKMLHKHLKLLTARQEKIRAFQSELG